MMMVEETRSMTMMTITIEDVMITVEFSYREIIFLHERKCFKITENKLI